MAVTGRHRVLPYATGGPPVGGSALPTLVGRTRRSAAAMDDMTPPTTTVMDDRTPPAVAVVDERTPPARPVRAPSPAHHRHARPRTRRHGSILYVAGGLLGASGTGWWLSETRHDGLHITGLRVPPSVVLWGLVGLAGWGALLLLGELALFVLAIVNVADREVHDRCRNLMILWGYVLTLGTPRLFRRLPAQFAQLFADEGTSRPSGRDRPGGRRPRRTRSPKD